MMEDNGRDRGISGQDVVQALPGLARIAAGAWWRTASWTVEASARAGSRVVRAAVSGESVGELVGDAREGLRSSARELLGVGDDPRDLAVRDSSPPPTAAERRAAHAATTSAPKPAPEGHAAMPLREQGALLLHRSADVRFEQSDHPAYGRILADLAPDEARVLRFLALEGAQPAVDVRAGRTPLTQSQMVAPGLSMIGSQAGVRYLDRVPAYLNNLFRLGLIWFSREPLEDPLRYQVLEAQPDVLAAMRRGGRGKTIRRSIHLTPFGEDFCRTCLPLGSEGGAIEGKVTD